MTTTITLNQSAKASIKEMYFQRPDLSAREIADFLTLNRKEVFAYMKQLGYTKEKHTMAVNARKLKLEQAKERDKIRPVLHMPDTYTNTRYSPLLVEKKMEAKLRKQVENTERQMMQAAEEGDMDAFIRYRKDYDAAQRRLAAYKERGTMSAEDMSIYSAENQYGTIN